MSGADIIYSNRGNINKYWVLSMSISYIIEMFFHLYLKMCEPETKFYRKREGPLIKFASGPMISLDGPVDHL